MKIQTTVDWITYSVPTGSDMGEYLPVGFELRETIKPLPYYNLAFELTPSGRIDMNTKVVTQGSKITLSGQDCRVIDRDYRGGCSAMLENITKRDLCKLTRVDIATDIFNSEANPDDLFEAFQAGLAVTKVKSCTQIHGYDKQSKRTGNTVSFGKRASAVYLRVYNKALESIAKSGLKSSEENEDGENELIETLRALQWSRVELELKEDKAILAGKSIAYSGCATTAKMALERFIDFPSVEWWQVMLEALPSAETNAMIGENHNKGKSDKWIMQQALPAILREILQGNFQVIDAVEKALSEYDAKSFGALRF